MNYARLVEDSMPTREELIEMGYEFSEEEKELMRLEDQAQRDAEGLEGANISAE